MSSGQRCSGTESFLGEPGRHEHQATGEVLVTKTSLIQSFSGYLRRYSDLHMEFGICLSTGRKRPRQLRKQEEAQGYRAPGAG